MTIRRPLLKVIIHDNHVIRSTPTHHHALLCSMYVYIGIRVCVCVQLHDNYTCVSVSVYPAP